MSRGHRRRHCEERSDSGNLMPLRKNMRSPRFARDDNWFKEKVVRSARPKGKRCRHRMISYPLEVVWKRCRQILWIIQGTWVIHESRLLYIRGTAHDAVVLPPRLGCNEVDAVRSARPKGKRCRHRMISYPLEVVWKRCRQILWIIQVRRRDPSLGEQPQGQYEVSYG